MSELVVPSFTRKLSWAEEHLDKLDGEIGKFRDRHPYRTRKVVKGKNKGEWIMEFTERPDPRWSLIVGDILYNLRSSLDHLAGALNPSSQRSHVMYPIVREEIWNIPYIDGENQERTRLREKWNVSTRHMSDEAVAVVQRCQPTDRGHEPYFHCLDLLNRLSNKDRHRTLHIHLTGLVSISVRFFDKDGNVYSVTAEPDVPEGLPGTAALKDKATIQMPPELPDDLIVDVKIQGSTTQAINMGQDGRQVIIPDALRQILDWIRNEAVAPLSPFFHGLK